MKKCILPYFYLTLANLVAAISFNLLSKPINLVSGGSPGLSLVVSQIMDISTSDIITIIYIITFILSFICLGKDVLIGVIFASVIYPIFVYLTEDITSIIVLNYNDIFLITIIAGILSGITNGIIYKNGFASSGIGILAPIFNKYFKISISLANFIINGIIVLLGGYFFGFNIILLALCYIYISSVISNRIILGISTNKALFIHSKHCEKIIKVLQDKYHTSATILKDDDGQNVLFVVLKNSFYSNLKNDLQIIDKKAFYTTDNCYEVKSG